MIHRAGHLEVSYAEGSDNETTLIKCTRCLMEFSMATFLKSTPMQVAALSTWVLDHSHVGEAPLPTIKRRAR